jgi:hypothetical protein
MRPRAADDSVTLWSAAVGDAAAAMKGGLSLANQGEAGCGRARTIADPCRAPRKAALPPRSALGASKRLITGLGLEARGDTL